MSADAPSRRGSLVISCVTALGVFLLAEQAVRGIEEDLPDPVEWYDAQAQVKVEQMERLDRSARDVDFVFAGTSMVFRGVDPSVFDTSSAQETFSYNAALLGAVPPVMERWVLEEVEPRLDPNAVVYGVSTIDFQERRYRNPVKSYENAPATRRGLMASVERLARRTLDLVRFRSLLRDPKVWQEPLRGPRGKSGPVERARTAVEGDGHAPKMVEEKDARERARIRGRVLKNFSISDKGTKSLERTVRTLKRRGVEVILVLMPVPSEYGTLHPRGRKDMKATRRHVTDRAKAWDVPLLDMSRSMADRYFVDFTHLGEKGADIFSDKLRRRVERKDL